MIFVGIKCDHCGNIGITQDGLKNKFITTLLEDLREALSKRRWRPVGKPVLEDVCPECIKKLSKEEHKALGKYTG